MSDRDYYIARGRSLAAVIAFEDGTVAYWKAVGAALAEAGVPTGTKFQYYTTWNRFVGLHVPHGEQVPDGFRREKRQPSCCVPDRKSAVGKTLAAKLKATKGPNEIGLCHAMCGQPHAWMGADRGRGGFSVGYYFPERVGGEWVVSCHEGGIPPYDCEPLPRSEYWRRKEAEVTP